jgi:hypothetical protein
LLALYDGAEASDVRATAFLEVLKEIQSEHTIVKRDGCWEHGLPSRDLVGGEVVELRVDDKVLVDMRFLRRRPAACRKPACFDLVDEGLDCFCLFYFRVFVAKFRDCLPIYNKYFMLT